MTLKSTRGSNIVLFICSLGRALTLRDSLNTAEYGPCQENFASGMRTVTSMTLEASPGGQGMHGYCPQPPGRTASLRDRQRDELVQETPLPRTEVHR